MSKSPPVNAGAVLRLTYMSKATSLAAHPNRTTAMAQLGCQSRRCNQLYGLTGALLAGQDWFIQTLEGDPVAVYATFARVNLDLRHQDVRVFEIASTDARMFPDWTMHVGAMEKVSSALLWQCGRAYRRVPPHSASLLLRALEESVHAA